MKQERREKPVAIDLKRYSEFIPPSENELIDASILFIEIFSGYPWFEVNKCDNCEVYTGPEVRHGESCNDCGGNLTDAYELDEVADFITGNLEKENGVMYLAETDNRVIGFAWGSQRSMEDLLPRFDDRQRIQVSKSLSVVARRRGVDKLFSISEIGVEDEYRGRGLGKQLTAKLQSEAEKVNALSTVWTRYDTALTPICLKQGYDQIYGPEVLVQGGNTKLTGQNIIGVHSKMPERVMFVK